MREGPKPEQIVVFKNWGSPPSSCVDKANKWLEENTGRVDILLRQISPAPNDSSMPCSAVMIWYREKE